MTNPDASNAGNQLAGVAPAPGQIAVLAPWPIASDVQSLVQTPVDVNEVRSFTGLDYYSRLEHLSTVRTLDHESRQKSLPVLTSLLAFALGGSATALAGLGAWSLIPLAFGGVAAVVVGKVGKRDAKRESTQAAWVKALEEVHAEVTKLNGFEK